MQNKRLSFRWPAIKKAQAKSAAPEMPPQETVEENGPIIRCENLVKIYKTDDIEVLALQGLELTVERGELMAIIGNSGSGKSTFLNMIGGLDKPSAGKLFVDGKDLFKLNEQQLVEYKRSTVGFVWQNNARNLLPYLTALQNVQMPMYFGTEREKEARALELLELVGMEHRKDHYLNQLSGGEQQRVAIALSLANEPRILLADEPTGAVDNATANMILDLFRTINKELGITVIIVTHDLKLSAKVDRVIKIRDGRTSTEYLKINNDAAAFENVNFGHTGAEATHQEYVVIDRVGRLQIPAEMLERAGIQNMSRVRLEFDNGRIVIVPFEN